MSKPVPNASSTRFDCACPSGQVIQPCDGSVPNDPLIRDMLDRLDDAFFDALDGCDAALAQARELWPKMAATFGPELLEESREQYLRRAVDITKQFEIDSRRSPEQALAALEVIQLLMQQA